MLHRIVRAQKQVSLAEREQGLARIPLVRSVLREIEERTWRLLLLEAARAALGRAQADTVARQLLEREASLQRRELARAGRELAQLGCAIVVSSPLTIQMQVPSGARMLWILGRC